MNEPIDIDGQIAALVADFADIILEHLGHLPGFGGPLAELLEDRRSTLERMTPELGELLAVSATEARLRTELLASARDGLRHNAMLLALAHRGDEAAAVRAVVARLR